MSLPLPNPLPMDPDYWGAEAAPFVPVFVEDPSATSPAEPEQPPVPGDAGKKES
jgi:hypothetical protein